MLGTETRQKKKHAQGLTLDRRAEFWFLLVLFPPVPIVPLGSGLPRGLVAVVVLLEAPVGLLAFFILGSKFLIHLWRNLQKEKTDEHGTVVVGLLVKLQLQDHSSSPILRSGYCLYGVSYVLPVSARVLQFPPTSQ